MTRFDARDEPTSAELLARRLRDGSGENPVVAGLQPDRGTICRSLAPSTVCPAHRIAAPGERSNADKHTGPERPNRTSERPGRR